MDNSQVVVKDAKRLFVKLGTCSRTLFYILNREFGHLKENEERAIDPLAGGIMQQGYECGMLWGASMAIGAESYRRHGNSGQAIASAITATQHVMRSFEKRNDAVDCFDVTGCDWTNKIAMMKFMITGRFLSCFKLAEKWAPEAIEAAYEGLSVEHNHIPPTPISCASEVVKKMGGSDEESIMVAGFAGGYGLGGHGCGALGAAIWKNSLEWCRETPGKSSWPNPAAQATHEAFQKASDYVYPCSEITGKSFKTIDEHTEFIKGGGCAELIETLAETKYSR